MASPRPTANRSVSSVSQQDSPYGRSPALPNIPPRAASPGGEVQAARSPLLLPADAALNRHSRHSSQDRSGNESGGEDGFGDLDGLPISDEQKARIVDRHLVRVPTTPSEAESYDGERETESGPSNVRFPSGTPGASAVQSSADEEVEEYFGPSAMQGGATTDDVYRWAHNNRRKANKRTRSESLHLPRTSTIDPDLDASAIKEPGGFRRFFVLNQADQQGRPAPRALRSFIDFLALYGHYGGEDLEDIEEDDVDEDEDAGAEEEARAGGSSSRGVTERSALISRQTSRTGMSRSTSRIGRRTNGPQGRQQGEATVLEAVMMLLKSFVGTGILFLGKAFMNGGLLFSTIVLCAVAMISLVSFLLLVKANLRHPASFGDMGGILYGPKMRLAILTSIVFSQLGFVAAYTVFVAQNLQAFILAVTQCRTLVPTVYLILAQAAVFLPLSLVRRIAKLSSTALVADVFILFGIVYLFKFEITQLREQGLADVVMFNPQTFSLFIGTAVFTFEGVGLVIPITESMKEPHRFPKALTGVMFGVMILFAASGALSYSAFGSKVQTVVISNLPRESKFVQAMQFLYSIAILLSTPLQLFPAVTILERGLFSKSGKYNWKVKVEKNIFRCSTVLVCAVAAWLGSASLDVFVSFIGSVACVPLCFIYPPLLHLRGCPQTRKSRALNYAILTFGIVCTLFAGSQTIITLINPTSPPDAPVCEPPK